MATNSYTRSQGRDYMVAGLQLCMLAFADDIVLFAPSVDLLQRLVSVFALFCKTNDLVINTRKTEVMLVNCTGNIYIAK